MLIKIATTESIHKQVVGATYKIKPMMIIPQTLICSTAFGCNLNMQWSANTIVKYMSNIGSWQPFSRKGIQSFYSKHSYSTFGHRNYTKRFMFNGLLFHGYILRNDIGVYFVTMEFVDICYKTCYAPKNLIL